MSQILDFRYCVIDKKQKKQPKLVAFLQKKLNHYLFKIPSSSDVKAD